MQKLLRGLMALVCASLLIAPIAVPVAAPSAIHQIAGTAFAQVAGGSPPCAAKDPKGNCILGVVDPASMPGTKAEAVVTSDSADQWQGTNVPRAIYVGVGGDVTMIGVDASSGATGVTWKAVPAGTIIPFRPRRILAGTTTATNLVAIF